MEVLILAAALWFGYESLKSLLAWLNTANSSPALFVYCLFAALLILYEGGWLLTGAHHL